MAELLARAVNPSPRKFVLVHTTTTTPPGAASQAATTFPAYRCCRPRRLFSATPQATCLRLFGVADRTPVRAPEVSVNPGDPGARSALDIWAPRAARDPRFSYWSTAAQQDHPDAAATQRLLLPARLHM